MNKSLANQICKLWNEKHVGNYERAKTHAIVSEIGGYSVEVHPCEKNDGHSFHHEGEVTDIERAFGVSAYITQDEEHKLYARFF